MTDSPSQSISRPKRHNQWLILIAVFKLANALLFVAIGVGAVKLLHKDAGDVFTSVAEHLRFSPESHIINVILKYAPLVNDQLLRRIGAVVFFYAALDLLEGIGLYLEKVWAEFLTLAITASFLPWEVFEIYRRLTLVRVSLLLVNAIVLIYLVKLVIARGKRANSSAEIESGE